MLRIFSVLLLALFLATSGCGTTTVDFDQLEKRDGLFYQIDSETPYTGTAIQRHENGKKKIEGSFKDGKEVGIWILWDEYGNREKGFNFDEAKYQL